MNYLTKKDQVILTQIFEISKEIQNIHMKISDFQTNNDICDDYYKSYSILRLLMRDEDKLYSSIDITIDKIDEIIESSMISNASLDLKKIITLNEDNIYINRIINQMMKRINVVDKVNSEINLIADEYGDTNEIIMQTIEMARKDCINIARIRSYIETDIYWSFLLYLENQNIYIPKLNHLISIIDSDIEEQMIKQNFVVKENHPIYSKLAFSLFGINDAVYEDICNDKCLDLFNYPLTIYLLNDKKTIESKLCFNMIKALLSMMSDNSYGIIKKLVFNKINDIKKNVPDYLKGDVGELIEVFDSIIEEKIKQKTVFVKDYY